MGKDLNGKELGVGLGQRKDGLYTARYVNQYGKRLQKYDKKLNVVRKWLTNIAYEDQHGLLGTGDSFTVNEWFEVWIKTYKEGVVKPNTVKNYRNQFKKNISPEIGSLKLKTIKKLQLQLILNNMYDQGYAYGTMELTKITMHAIFDGAVQSDIIVKNPAQGIKCKQREVSETRVMDVIEENDFREAAKESMYYNMFVLMLETGLRCGEAGGLFWEDINLEKQEILINRTLLFDKKMGGFYYGTPKNTSSIRRIPLSNTAIEVLKEQKKLKFKFRCKSKKWSEDEKHEDLVFCTINGSPVVHSTINKMITRTSDRVNSQRMLDHRLNGTPYVEFKGIHSHTLRHTFATRCIENGMNPKILQQILGHSTFNVTMDLYVHPSMELHHEEIKKCEEKRGVNVV